MSEISQEELSQEIIEHLMHPKNYGKLDDPSGVGVGHDEKSGEYVIFYIQSDNVVIHDVRFATNGCQDTVILGSMFTEMIKQESIKNAKKAAESMREKMSHQSNSQQVCADMVLGSFDAALINHDNRKNSIDEEMHVVVMSESCEIVEESSYE
jgi:nitrogen fixation protein NifU and related proteins